MNEPNPSFEMIAGDVAPSQWLARNMAAIQQEQFAKLALIRAGVALQAAIRHQDILDAIAQQEHDAADCDCDECRAGRGK